MSSFPSILYFQRIVVLTSFLHQFGLHQKDFEIDSRDRAESYRNFTLNVSRNEFPDLESDEDYLVDYIGMDVFDSDINLLGTVVDVLTLPADDYLVVGYESKEFLVPIIEQIVKKFDFSNNRIIIDPIEGLIE